MIDYVSFFLRPAFNAIISFMVTIWLRSRGVVVGRGFRCFQIPKVNVDMYSKLTIGDNVQFSGSIDIRVLDGSSFTIGSSTKIDEGVRFVLRNASKLELMSWADVGKDSIFNIGRDVCVGEYFLCAGYCYLQTSSHRIDLGTTPIRNSGYEHGEIKIGENCWMGAYSMVLGESMIGDHCVIGAYTLVKGQVTDGDVVVGQPAKKIRNRLAR
jgi:acetyltransferase-like isoleucine patch superfamily enzyme